jgi:hypothetical protein
MRSMSDEQLDKVFREASEGIDFPPDNEAWKAMSAKLDQRPVVTPFWSKTKISIIVTSGILLMGLVWFFNALPDEIELATNTTKQVMSEVDQSQENETIPDSNGSSNSDSNVSVKPESIKAVEHQNSVVQNIDGGLHRTDNFVYQASKKDRQGYVSNIVKNISASTTNNDFPASRDTRNAVTSESDIVDVKKSVSKPHSDLNIEEILPVIKTENKEEATKKDSLMIIASEKPEESPEKILMPKVFSLKLAVAPDFSTVKFSSFESPGFNYGVMLGYSFNSKLSVFTGALSSRKIYSSTGGGNYSTGYNDYPIKRIDGNCRIIDIPVNFYYTISSKQSISIKLGLGVSSYLMLDEAYVYVLDKQYGDDTYTQNIVNKNQEWFKVANISVILEKQLSNRMFLELEPFVKAPLAGVGEGKVSLVSLGAFLNIRYDFQFNNK